MKRCRGLSCILLLTFLWAGLTQSARAELAGVSSLDPGVANPSFSDILPGSALDIPPREVVLNLANGFPLWYQDSNGRKLELCLEQQKTRADNQASFLPCLTAAPILTRPISFPSNLGLEAFYWVAVGSGTFNSSDGSLGDMLVVMAHEMTFPNFIVTDGQQMVFARIRLRLNLPVPGTYRVTHPFGTRDYLITTTGAGREINQTQDVGILTTLDFTASLADAPAPAPSAPLLPSINEGVVNNTGASIGPYLGAAGALPIFDTDGNLYLSNPGTDLVPILTPIEPGLNGVDYFEVELLDPPAGFFLNAAASSQVVRLTGFQVAGKFFNDGPNLPPTAVDDTAITQTGRSVLIDAVANDLDVREIDLNDPFNPANPANTNVHGINDQAVALIDADGTTLLRRVDTLTTPLGATVRRTTDAVTGRALFFYTPGAPGEDSFSYVVQDKGGLISQPATVSVTVEDLSVQRAEFRARTGKWRIEGDSSDTTDNSVSLFSAPRALLLGSNQVTPIVSDATGTVYLELSDQSIRYLLSVNPLPASSVTRISINFGNPGEDGQVIFPLFNSQFDREFTGSLSGQLNAGRLQPDAAIGISNLADAIRAIQDGRTYINVSTSEHGTGEIRGQLTRKLIATVPVAADGSWIFVGRSTTVPGRLPSLSLESANGNRLLNIPVLYR